MKRWGFVNLLSLVIMATFTMSCQDDSSDELVGNWIDRYSFEGVARSHAVAFTIDDKGYLLSGYDGDERVRLKDAWNFDPEKNTWSRIADFPGVGRTSAFGFAANGKGYVGTGYDGTTKLSDFYQYDPTLNQWTELDPFPGSARYGACTFTVDNKGYVLGGYDGNYLKDLWMFDPETKSWTQKTSLPGSKRYNAIAFVIDNKAYACTGNENGSYPYDLWEYDPANDSWTKKREIANKSDESYDDNYVIVRQNAVSFVINGRGYIATGDSDGLTSTVWEYDPSTDLWTKKTNFQGSARSNAVSFTINNRGFVATGRYGSQYLDDVWEFEPFATDNEND